MHVQARIDAALGRGQEVANTCFYQHGLQTGDGQELRLVEPRHVAIDGGLLSPRAQLSVWLDDPHHLVIWRPAVHFKLRGVRVAHADLADLDLRLFGPSRTGCEVP